MRKLHASDMADTQDILIIDANPLDRAEIRRLLLTDSTHQRRIIEADCGHEGIRLAFGRRGRPLDCILLSCNLPDMDTIAVLEALCGNDLTPIRPVVAVTDSCPVSASILLQTGAQDCIERNMLTLEALTRCIDNAISRYTFLTLRQQRQEEHFRVESEVASMGILAIDYARDTAIANAIAADQFGLPAGIAVSRSAVHDRFHPDDRAELSRRIARCLDPSGDGVFAMEHRVIRPDDSIRWLSVRKQVTFERTPQGQRPVAATLMAVDITARKQAEIALYQSDSKFRSIFSNAAVGFIMTTPEGDFVEANPAFSLLTGYSSEEIGNLNLSQLIHPDDRDNNIVQIQRMLDGEISNIVIENRYIRKDGQTLWVKKSISLIKDAGGKPQWIIALTEDISERKAAEEAVKESESRFRATFEQAAVGIAHVSLEGRWLRVNQRLCDIVGYSREELLQTTFQDITYPEDLDADLAQNTRLLNGEISLFSMEKRYIMKNGSLIWINLTVSLMRDAVGKPLYFISVVEDIADRKRVEATLQIAYDIFRNLVENSPFGIYAVDADFRLVQVSTGAQKVFKNVHPLLGRDFGEVLRGIWQEPFASEAINRFRHTLDTGESYHAPSTIERRQDINEIEAYDWKIERVMLPDGRFGVVCHFYDLSERLRYEAALLESEERLRLAAQTAGFGIHDYDVADDQSFWTPELYAISGIAEGVKIDMEAIRNFIHPADRNAVLTAMEAALDPTGTGSFSEEFRIRRGDTGETRWVYNRSQTVFEEKDNSRRPVRNTGIIQDITDRKEAELALRESEERLNLATEAGRLGAWEWNIATDRIVWSQQMERNAGFAPHQFAGTMEAFRALIYPDDLERVNQAISRTVNEGAEYAAEFRMVRPDGNLRWASMRGTVIRDPEGNPVRMLGVDLDVTERWLQQNAIEELNLRLRRAMEESHHRIKNNLQALSAVVDLQRMDAAENVSVSGLVRLSSHIQTLASLHDLLTMELRSDGGNVDTLSLRSALEKMLPLMETAGGGRRIVMCAEDIRAPLKQGSNFTLLVNELVANAIKHGQGEITINLRREESLPTNQGKPSAPYAQLEVCDDGPGFPQDFDLERAANTGLRLIESIGVWDMDGKLEFGNRAEGGARVIVTFPILWE